MAGAFYFSGDRRHSDVVGVGEQVSLGSHQKTIGDSQDWITPRCILEALGEFDLDPAGADPRPWDCAHETYTQNGLVRSWRGRVWLNPPFHRYYVGHWVKRLARHGVGTALLHARTEAEWFEPVWEHAQAILFLADRLYFHFPDGRRAEANSGAPACLVAFGDYDYRQLRQAPLAGAFVTGWIVKTLTAIK